VTPYDFERDDAFPELERMRPETFDLPRHRELVRTALVFALVASGFVSLVVLAFLSAAAVFEPDTAARAAGILSPLVGAGGVALGFYFRPNGRPL